MKSETRNPKPEVQQLHAVLTPSELAALLGPCTAQVTESAPTAAETSASQWNSFAEEFSRRLTTRLRPLIRAAVRVTFSGSRTLTAETLATSQEAREVVSLWQSVRSIEPLAVVLSVPLVAAFVDRLLGGRSAPNGDEADLHRPLTEVDQRFASRLSEAVRQSVSEQSESASPLELTELSGNTNSLLEAWLPDCSLLRLSFDLRFVQGGGSLDLLLPTEIADSLADQPEVAESRKMSLNPSAECPTISSRRSVVVAQLSQTSLSRNDLQSLAVGDVLLMPTNLNQSVRVLIDGHSRFDGIAGTLDGHKAIRLTNAGSARAS